MIHENNGWEEDDDLDSDTDHCIVCGRTESVHEFSSYAGCGNALCRSCASSGEDDFGNVHCQAGCGI